MSSRRKNSRLKTSRANRWSWVLRCILLFGIWQGPRPWCHSHGTLSNSADILCTSFDDHLRSHHAAVDPLSNLFLGWHVHVDLPGTSTGDPDQRSNSGPQLLPLSSPFDSEVASLARATQMPGVPTALLIEQQQGAAAIAVEAQLRHSAHFLEAFAPALPLPLRLCVNRC